MIRSKFSHYISIRGCEWNLFKKQNKLEKIPLFKYHGETRTENQLITEIFEGTFFGLVRVSIRIPPEKRQLWKTINFPPIFHKRSLREDELCEEMLQKLKIKKARFPLGKRFFIIQMIY